MICLRKDGLHIINELYKHKIKVQPLIAHKICASHNLWAVLRLGFHDIAKDMCTIKWRIAHFLSAAQGRSCFKTSTYQLFLVISGWDYITPPWK